MTLRWPACCALRFDRKNFKSARVAPFTQEPMPGYPSKVEEMAVRKVERRDPQAVREAMAFRVAERQHQARALVEARSHQLTASQKLSR